MKVLWASNGPWAGTGYGQQTGEIVPRIGRYYGPENVAIGVMWGLQGGMMKRDGIACYPQGSHPYSDDILTAHAYHHFRGDVNAGIVITLFDVWVFQNPSWEKVHVASWTPVDHMPVPPGVLAFFKRTGSIPIAMSKYGKERLEVEGLKPFYAPHSIDTNVFKRTAIGRDNMPVRKQWDIPESAFVIGMVAANKGSYPPRKAFAETMLAFSRFKQDHPEALLYLHTEASGMHDGINMPQLATACGLTPDDVKITDGYLIRMGLHPKDMATIYSCFDVLVAPSLGEGFGIPVIEAQACGVPVIVSNFSAQPELVGAGWTVEGQPLYDNAQAAWFQLPYVDEIHHKFELAYKRSEMDVQRHRKEARDFVVKSYDTSYVWREHWLPTLDWLDKHITENPKEIPHPEITT